jgi:(p)ppGpp synthase/HD superfamily hydrolase
VDQSARVPPASETPAPPAWIAESQVLARAYRLAASAHASQHRATDGAPFLEHVVEVATLLSDAGFDQELVVAGLLHDAVERGTLTEERLRREMGNKVSELVLSLTEDSSIESFVERKAALRQQVRAAGLRAITIFAADKLSDINGLRRGTDRFGEEIEERMGTTVDGMASHYRESVEMIEAGHPSSAFIPDLHARLEELDRYAAGQR